MNLNSDFQLRTCGISEDDLKEIQGISRTNFVLAIKEAESIGLILDVSSHDGRAWMLSNDGNLYVRALLADLKTTNFSIDRRVIMIQDSFTPLLQNI